jgi:hypothetical protein
MPLALAATVVLTAIVSLLVFERESQLETNPLTPFLRVEPEAKPAERPAAEAPGRATRADEAQRAVPSRSDAARERAERPAQVFVPDAPPAAERREEAQQAAPPPAPPAAAAPALAPAAPAERRAGQAAPMPAPARALSREASERRQEATSAQARPEDWIENIRSLKTQGRSAEAERALAEFKRRFPDYPIPQDLN